MKRFHFTFLLLLASLVLLSCAPVIRKDLMEQAVRNPSLIEIKRNPEAYQGKLFVFGGIIVSTRVTADGSLIEALYSTVDFRGDLKSVKQSEGRFLALFPKASGILDPIIFSRGRNITVAVEFIGLREGKLDEMAYTYPFFRVRELYLWEETREYYYPYYPYYDPFYYSFYYDRPFLFHRHFRHFR